MPDLNPKLRGWKFKVCSYCKKRKSRNNFPKPNPKYDGYIRPYCRQCDAERVRIYHRKNRDKVRKKQQRAEAKKRRNESHKKTRLRYPEKAAARYAVKKALWQGRLTKAKTCHNCGKKRPLMNDHHLGYAKKNWLDVQWVCRPCDGIRRRKYR